MNVSRELRTRIVEAKKSVGAWLTTRTRFCAPFFFVFRKEDRTTSSGSDSVFAPMSHNRRKLRVQGTLQGCDLSGAYRRTPRGNFAGNLPVSDKPSVSSVTLPNSNPELLYVLSSSVMLSEKGTGNSVSSVTLPSSNFARTYKPYRAHFLESCYSSSAPEI